jgi:putative transposase
MSYNNLRKGRFSQPDGEYLVTAVTHQRRRVFEDERYARELVWVMHDTAEFRLVWLLAWVIMPDHMHVLLRLGINATLSELVQVIKANSARRINAMAGRSGALWQPGFHDHALRKEENRALIARYIIENPVRAGLVERVEDYPHWGLLGGRKTDL